MSLVVRTRPSLHLSSLQRNRPVVTPIVVTGNWPRRYPSLHLYRYVVTARRYRPNWPSLQIPSLQDLVVTPSLHVTSPSLHTSAPLQGWAQQTTSHLNISSLILSLPVELSLQSRRYPVVTPCIVTGGPSLPVVTLISLRRYSSSLQA